VSLTENEKKCRS